MTNPAPEDPSATQPDDSGRRHRGPRGGLIAGLVLLAIVAMVFAHHGGWNGGHPMGWHGAWQGGWQMTGHWWAALLLIPGVGLLVRAIRRYRGLGEADGRVVGAAVGGVVLTGLALKLFFGFGGHVLWPLLLVAGVIFLSRRAWRHRMG